MKTIDVNIDNLMHSILKIANSRRESAGHQGCQHDGGASKLEMQVTFYKYGRNNELPKEWEEFAIQLTKQNDSEYDEYLRLKNKFEN